MRIRAVALAGVSALLLSACSTTVVGVATPSGPPPHPGPSAPTTTTLAPRSAYALEQAGAVRMQAELTDDVGRPVASLDLHLVGGNVAGTVVADDTTIQLVVVDGAAYVNAPAQWWTTQGAAEAAAAQVDGAWVHMPDDFAAEFATFTVPVMAESIRHPSGGSYDEDVHPVLVDGQQVWQMSNPGGDAVWVAAEGTPYPVGLSATRAVAGQYYGLDATLSEFGVAPPIAVPADAIDLGG
jgi:hypothetical protein